MIQIEEKDLKEAVTMALGSQGIWTPELASTMFIEIQKQALNIDDVVKSFTAEQVLEELEGEENIYDARKYFKSLL